MRNIFLVLLLSGCAAGSSWNASVGNPSNSTSPPVQTLIVDKQVQGMSRNEVINAVQECEGSGLRAIVLTTKRQINGFATDIIFDITCAPKLKTY